MRKGEREGGNSLYPLRVHCACVVCGRSVPADPLTPFRR